MDYTSDDIVQWVAYFAASTASPILYKLPIPVGGVHDNDDPDFIVRLFCLLFCLTNGTETEWIHAITLHC